MNYFLTVFLSALIIVILEWFLFLRYFALQSEKEIKRLEQIYGYIKKDPYMETWPFFIHITLVAPPIEEFIFRGPILFFIEFGVIWAVTIAVISAILFGLCHRNNTIKFLNGTELPLPWSFTWYTSGGGFLYGLVVIFFGSLWLAILTHSLWNLSTVLVPKIIGEKNIKATAELVTYRS